MISLKDPNQVIRDEHDEKNNAKRVMIVGSDLGSSISSMATKEFLETIRNIKFEQPKAPEFFTVEKEVVVKEYELLKVPEILIKYEKIEVPKIIIETKIVEIEKPIIVTKVIEVEKQKDMTKVMMLFFIGQLIILALSKFI